MRLKLDSKIHESGSLGQALIKCNRARVGFMRQPVHLAAAGLTGGLQRELDQPAPDGLAPVARRHEQIVQVAVVLGRPGAAVVDPVRQPDRLACIPGDGAEHRLARIEQARPGGYRRCLRNVDPVKTLVALPQRQPMLEVLRTDPAQLGARRFGHGLSVRSMTSSVGRPGGSNVQSDRARRTSSSSTRAGLASMISTWSTLPSGVTHRRTRTWLSRTPSSSAEAGNWGGSCRRGRSVTRSLAACGGGAAATASSVAGAWSSLVSTGAGIGVAPGESAPGATPSSALGASAGPGAGLAAVATCTLDGRAAGMSTFTAAAAAKCATAGARGAGVLAATGNAPRDSAPSMARRPRTRGRGAGCAGKAPAAGLDAGTAGKPDIGVTVMASGSLASIASVDVGARYVSIGSTCASV